MIDETSAKTMIRLFFDENFNGRILDGVRLHLPDAELLRVQDIGMEGTPDPGLLEWTTNEHRILVTHDVKTMIRFAYERISAGQYLAGVFIVDSNLPIGQAIEALVDVVLYSDASEYENRVVHLPL